MRTREEINAYRREWYQKNKSKEQARLAVSNKKRQREVVSWYREYKAAQACVVCGEDHPACLDFHHQGDKAIEISRLANGWASKERLLEELKKCVAMCANCHRKHHYDERVHSSIG